MATAHLQKAAVLLKSLSEEQATILLRKLEPSQAAAVKAAMEGLQDIDEQQRNAVVREFAASHIRKPASSHASESVPFGFLQGLEPSALLKLLSAERAQTFALVLACLPSQKAGEVIELLPPGEQLAVVCRIATMNVPSSDVISDIEDGLRRRLFGVANHRSSNRGISSVVRMLNTMEPTTERKLLQNLSKAAPDLLREIRRTMFGVDVPMIDTTEAVC